MIHRLFDDEAAAPSILDKKVIKFTIFSALQAMFGPVGSAAIHFDLLKFDEEQFSGIIRCYQRYCTVDYRCIL